MFSSVNAQTNFPNWYIHVLFPEKGESLDIKSEEDLKVLKNRIDTYFCKDPTPVSIYPINMNSSNFVNKFRETFDNSSSVFSEKSSFKGYSFKIAPRTLTLEKTKLHQGKMRKATYVNGIVENVCVDGREVHGTRRFPDGTEEKGRCLGKSYWHGYRKQNEDYTFYRPSNWSLIGSKSEDFFFACLPDSEIMLLEKNPLAQDSSYLRSSRSKPEVLAEVLLENLSELRQDKDRIKTILTLVCVSNDAFQSFTNHFLYVAKTSSHLEILFELLKEFAEEKEFALSLGTQTMREELFVKWMQLHSSISIGFMLEIDPTLASVKIDGKSALYCISKNRRTYNAMKYEYELLFKMIFKAWEKTQHQLTSEELWIKRILQEDLHFNDDDFHAISVELKHYCYEIANLYGREQSISRLSLLGCGENLPTNSYAIKDGQRILVKEMNGIQAKDTIHMFLKDLRKEGLLLTEAEFCKEPLKYRKKGNYLDFGRIFGKQFIQQKIDALKITTIKVAKKILVIKPESDENPDHIRILPNITGYDLCLESPDLICYAEEIIRSYRKITYSEMVDLIDVIEATGFADICPANFIIADDAVYFIDTEYKSFQPIDYDKLYRLSGMLNYEDDELKFKNLIEERRKTKKFTRKEQSLVGDRRVPYIFSIAELTE